MNVLRLADVQGKDGRPGHPLVGESAWQNYEAVILVLVVAVNAAVNIGKYTKLQKIYLLISGRPARSHTRGFLRLADVQGKDGRPGHPLVGKSAWQNYEAVILVLVVAVNAAINIGKYTKLQKTYLLISGHPARSRTHGFLETN